MKKMYNILVQISTVMRVIHKIYITVKIVMKDFKLMVKENVKVLV